MSREANLSVAEREFVLEALRQGQRLDGRQADQYRPLSISFGEEYGHVKLQLGKTSLVVRISAEVTKPRDERPFDGLFNINVELSAMGSPRLGEWPVCSSHELIFGALLSNIIAKYSSNDAEAYVANVVDRVVRHSNALDTESLCIVQGVSCWSIRADVHVLDFDGNLTDAVCIAVMTGLQHFRRPDAVVRDGQVIVYGIDERVPVALNITHKPLSVTFNAFNEGKNLILDASLKEELASEGELVIGINNGGEVCFLSKFAGAPVDAHDIVEKSNVALEKVKEINARIDKVLLADLSRRGKKGMMEESRAENDREIDSRTTTVV
ncbi:Exosome complex endonuclease 2/ribosomal RNA processing protein [Penicillium chermesinum]|nr:Exosome complex endonuclease 2/ribosomal RNA processing protein [Penicillium chermesinum]